MSVEKWDKKLGGHDRKRKNYSVEEISPFSTVFFKEEIAILQEIVILQQLQFSTCFIVCCVTRLFFSQLVLYQSWYHPYTGRPV